MVLLLFVSGCEARYPYVDKEKTDSYLYDKVGFEAGRNPQNASNPVISKVAPDRYYRQPTNPEVVQQNRQPQQPQYQQLPPQQPYPYYVPQVTYPYQPQPYYYQQEIRRYNVQQQDPGSRFYSNPYAIPPTTQAPRYDGDQFYSPPTSQHNQEPILEPSEFNQQ